MNRYPERDALALRADLARYLGHGLAAEQVWAANGSNEVMLHVLQAFAGPGRTVLSFAPTYSMYPEYARDTHSAWRTSPRRDDFTIDADEAVAAIAENRPDVVLLASPNNPTGTAVDLDVILAICDAAPGRGGGRRGVLRVRPGRHAERAGAAAELSAAGGQPDHVQGVRLRRRPARLPGRDAGVRRRAAHRPAALPPVHGHPGGGPGGPGPRRRDAGRGRPAAGRPGRPGRPGWPARVCRSPSPTPTSCCSAGSPTGTRSGRRCWTAEC